MSAPDAPLLPTLDVESRPFFEGALRGELRVQRCPETGRLLFPPRTRSPWAPHRPPEWTTVSGRGAVWSFAVPHPPLLPWYAARAPYVVAVVALTEDPRVRMVGALVPREGGELGDLDPAEVAIGAPVRVVFERVADGIALPRWAPDPDPAADAVG